MYFESNEERKARETREIEMMAEQARWRAFMQKMNEQANSGRNSNSTQGAATAAGSAGGGGSILYQGDQDSKNQTSLIILRELGQSTYRYYIANYYSEKISGPFDTGVSVDDYELSNLYVSTILYGGYGLRFYRPEINEHTLIFLTSEGSIVESITAISTDVDMNDYEGRFIVATDYDEDLLWVFDGKSLLTNTSIFNGTSGFSIGNINDRAIPAGVGVYTFTENLGETVYEFYLCNGTTSNRIYDYTIGDGENTSIEFSLYMNLNKLVVTLRNADDGRLKRVDIVSTTGIIEEQIEIDTESHTDSNLNFFGDKCFFLHLWNGSDDSVKHQIYTYDGTTGSLHTGEASAVTFVNWSYVYRDRSNGTDYNYDSVNNALIIFRGTELSNSNDFIESDNFLIFKAFAGSPLDKYTYAEGESKRIYIDDAGMSRNYSLLAVDSDMSDEIQAMIIKKDSVNFIGLGNSILDLDDIDITENGDRIVVVVEYNDEMLPVNTIAHSFNSIGAKNNNVLELSTTSHSTKTSYGTYIINGDSLDSYLSPSGNWIQYPSLSNVSNPQFFVNSNQTSAPYVFAYENTVIPYTHTQMTGNTNDEAALEDFLMDGAIVPGINNFGQGSSYFTNQYPGLFVLAAKSISISSFRIDGNIGADGGGQVSTDTRVIPGYSKDYTAYIKQVYDSGDPSINHIIIVDTDGTGINQDVDLSSEDDFHQISGIEAATEIHYLLLATNNGSLISSEKLDQIITEYLDQVDQKTLPDILENLNSQYSNITGVLPAVGSGEPDRIYYFNSVADSPSSIDDGGDDMYDTANLLYTSLTSGIQCRIFKKDGSVKSINIADFDSSFFGKNGFFLISSEPDVVIRQYNLNGTLVDQVDTKHPDWEAGAYVENRGLFSSVEKIFDGIDIYWNTKIYMMSKKGISSIEANLTFGVNNNRVVHNDYGWLND